MRTQPKCAQATGHSRVVNFYVNSMSGWSSEYAFELVTALGGSLVCLLY